MLRRSSLGRADTGEAAREGEVEAMSNLAPTVVVVEDDPDLQFLTTLMLTKAGYVVRSYGDAREAVPACIESPPDAVVLDWMLPGMSGIDALRELRRHPETAALPVVMATACGSSDRVAAALASGAQGYLVKPFGAAELASAVSSAREAGVARVVEQVA
jgi:two-component system phosphate regulon response regulator PhoB